MLGWKWLVAYRSRPPHASRQEDDGRESANCLLRCWGVTAWRKSPIPCPSDGATASLIRSLRPFDFPLCRHESSGRKGKGLFPHPFLSQCISLSPNRIWM